MHSLEDEELKKALIKAMKLPKEIYNLITVEETKIHFIIRPKTYLGDYFAMICSRFEKFHGSWDGQCFKFRKFVFGGD